MKFTTLPLILPDGKKIVLTLEEGVTYLGAMGPLFLFNDRVTRDTLALRESELTTEALETRILDKRRAFFASRSIAISIPKSQK